MSRRMAEQAEAPSAKPPSNLAESASTTPANDSQVSIVDRFRDFLGSRFGSFGRRSFLVGAGRVGGIVAGTAAGVGAIPVPAVGKENDAPKTEGRRSAEIMSPLVAFDKLLYKKDDQTPYDEAYAVEALSASPVNSPGFYTETDSAGFLRSINMLDRDATNKDRYTFAYYNQGALAMTDLFKRSDDALPITAKAIAVSGNIVTVTGENATNPGTPAALVCNTGGSNFQPTDVGGFKGNMNEQQALDGTSKIVVNLFTTDPSSSLGVFDSGTRVMSKPEGLNALTKDGLIVDKSQLKSNKVITTYATVSTGGYAKNVIDLSTNPPKAISSEVKHAEFNSMDGFTAAKDTQDKVTKLLGTDNALRKLFVVNATDHNKEAEYDFRGWLNGKGIIGYAADTLRLNALEVVGDYVWAGGDFLVEGSSRSVLIAWKLGEEPATTLKHFVLADKRAGILNQQSMKFVKMDNGVQGMLLYARRLGYGLLETGVNGAPIENAKKLWFKKLSSAIQAPGNKRQLIPIIGNNSPNLQDLKQAA